MISIFVCKFCVHFDMKILLTKHRSSVVILIHFERLVWTCTVYGGGEGTDNAFKFYSELWHVTVSTEYVGRGKAKSKKSLCSELQTLFLSTRVHAFAWCAQSV